MVEPISGLDKCFTRYPMFLVALKQESYLFYGKVSHNLTILSMIMP